MIFEELILNKVSEIETSNPGDLSSVAAIYVETRFSMKNSGGIDLTSLRADLKAEAINIFSLYYSNLGKELTFFTDNTVSGTAITSEGDRITLERVEFINLGEEECEDVVFKKVFFIPLSLLSVSTTDENLSTTDENLIDPGGNLPVIARIKICNYRDFKKKVRFIQTFMKINFLVLQRPTSRSIVKGINFRKFSTKKKQLTKLTSFLDTVIPNKPNKDGESIIIHFADNFQTISRIEYVNEKVSNEMQLVFRQSAEEFETRKYKALNDARANFYLYNFESIYPDLFATTFRGLNIKFDNLVRRNFIAPNVDIVQNDCLAAANSRQNVSAADITARIRQSLSDVPTREARSLLRDNPFKTAEDLIDESGFLESSDVRAAMEESLRKEFLVGGSSIKDEVSDFFEQLQNAGSFISSDQDSQALSKFGQFANSIEWQQILAIALASTASRYGIDELLDDSFVKKIMAERISNFFKDPRTIRALMIGLPTSALQRAALFFATADLANSVDGEFFVPTEEQLLNDFRNSALEEGILLIGDGPAEVPEFDGEPDDEAEEVQIPDLDTTDRTAMRRRLVNISQGDQSVGFTTEIKNEIIDLIIGLSNCDRQNNAEVYTEFIMFLVDELGAPILEYFDEWSEWLNAWDVKNLDFCNLPDLNLPDFKLFPLNIRLPDISMPDIFGFILGSVLSILYALLLRLIKALVQFLLSLIPDFIFDFEPCEFANALRDFGQTLAGAICAGLDGVDLPSVAACSVLTPRIGNQRNNRDLLNFFKDACGKGILPGPDLARLLDGDVSEDTFQRADVYFRAINSDLASEIRLNPSILSDAGSAMGSIIGIGDLLDTLDGFSPQLPGLSANGFVNNLDLCSDPNISDLIDQLCTEPNPALREELEKILQQQREADKDDAAKIFKYLTDPESLTREIEDQLPNQAHPSLLIPQLAAAGQTNELPVIKNTPKFALNRDQEALGELHEDNIKATLGSLDSCVAAYGTSLIERSRRYEDKLDKLEPPEQPIVTLEEADIDVVIGEAFRNDLFYIDEMPPKPKELAYQIIERNPEINSSDKKSFDIGVSFYEEEVSEPLGIAIANSETDPESPLRGLVNGDETNRASGALSIERIKEGQLVKQALDKISFNEEVDFDTFARQMETTGKSIAAASLRIKLENSGISLDEGGIAELLGGNEEVPKGSSSSLLPSSQLEVVMEDYLNGSLKQEMTYKRFIKELPEYSQLLLTKTDDEIASIKENIKTIFTCILLEDAHLRFAVLNTAGYILSINDFSTSIYNRSSAAQKVKVKINTLFSDFEVNYLNNKIYGWNAISYYVYEIAKITGQLSSLSRSLGRRATPQDLMFLLIDEAASSVSGSFATGMSSENQLLYSAIEGTEPASIIYNFKTPLLEDAVLAEEDFGPFLTRGADADGPRGKTSFLVSNLSYKVTLKSESTLATSLEDVDQNDLLPSSDETTAAERAVGSKMELQRLVFLNIKNGNPVLLGHDDLFETENLMASIQALTESEDSLEDFVFNNFNVSMKYRVLSSYLTKFLSSEFPRPPEQAIDQLNMISSETKTLGLYRDQKISTILAAAEAPIFGINGAGFIMTELCSFEREINTPQETQDNQLISNLMLSNNTSQLASDFKANASINIFLSCMLPIPNIINEATSYSVGKVIEEIADEEGEAGPLGLVGDVEVRDIIFKPVKIQNKICTKVSKDFLKNV